MVFSFQTLNADFAEVWLSLRLEGVCGFPLGFLITEEEALRTSIDRARNILRTGTMRGVFDGEKLIGFCVTAPKR